MEYEIIVTRIAVIPKGGTIYCNDALTLSMQDEAAGAFFVVRGDSESGRVALGSEVIPEFKKAVDYMENVCANYNRRKNE
jgi:hypothetical protein